VKKLADVKSMPVAWLWPGYIPRGKLTLLIGDPGCGKSYLLASVMARITSGQPWPDGAPAVAPCECVLIQAEDGEADTVRPRIDGLGGDPSRVLLVEGPDRWLSLDTDLAQLEPVLSTGRVGLLVVDPLTAYLGKADSYKDQDIRGVLSPLGKLADRTGVAVVAVMHLTKNEDRKVLYRAGGSIAFAASARKVLVVAKDPDEPERRHLFSTKENVGRPSRPLAFRIDEQGLTWEGASDVNTDELLRPAAKAEEQGAPKLHAAMQLLKETLADGPVSVPDVQERAKAHGHNWKTVEKAKRLLGVEPISRPGGGWLWVLPGERREVSSSPLLLQEEEGFPPPLREEDLRRRRRTRGPLQSDRAAGLLAMCPSRLTNRCMGRGHDPKRLCCNPV
jgi:hypothetical protein